jgi:hypothetical protein
MDLQEHYIVLHQWEGRVVEVGSEGFRARVRELGPGAAEEEYGDFSFESVSPDDEPLVVVGGVFYWFVGYRREPSGQRSNWGSIRFRRLPRWTKKDLDALDAPSDLDEFFGAK